MNTKELLIEMLKNENKPTKYKKIFSKRTKCKNCGHITAFQTIRCIMCNSKIEDV